MKCHGNIDISEQPAAFTKATALAEKLENSRRGLAGQGFPL